MSELLLELFSEEIPARMQARAADDLKKLVTDGLVDAGLVYEGARAFVTPRRLALAVSGVPAKSPGIREERKGPRVGAPDKAVEGFLKSAGLASVEEAEIRADEKKGDFYVAVIEKPGRRAEEVIAELVPEMVAKFPWPKSMRWGAESAKPGAPRWVRPLQSILCTYGPETELPETVRFSVGGIASGNTTEGHRFHAPDRFEVRRFDDYVAGLEKAHVVLDPERRRNIIAHDARDAALAMTLELVEDEGLLAEVAGLVEWPVVLSGSFDEAFLDLPDEVIRTSIRAHQKCFVLRDPKTGSLANRFILVANLVASDGGIRIVAGNERVIRARLSDAMFFWNTDLKTPLDTRAGRLADITFHAKLGTQAERVERIRKLAREIALVAGADPDLADRAATLAKADLVTEMVGEFPELQGLMGRYYALAQGEDGKVAAAIEDHYRPQGPSDAVPSEPVAVSVALADKLDMLTGFWAIDEKPTGSKDPYALRRAALGVIRIILDNRLRLPLHSVATHSRRRVMGDMLVNKGEELIGEVPFLSRLIGDNAMSEIARVADKAKDLILKTAGEAIPSMPWEGAISADLLSFVHERLKVHLRESGARHDLIDAVIGPDADDLLTIVERVEALGRFLDTEDGQSLLAGHKRAVNILRIEEKKDGRSYDELPHADRLTEDAEIALAAAIGTARAEVKTAVAAEDFEAAMTALAKLRGPVDRFFDEILVNAENPELRENRLKLLNEIRTATLEVADFHKIAG